MRRAFHDFDSAASIAARLVKPGHQIKLAADCFDIAAEREKIHIRLLFDLCHGRLLDL
jgi:hypothetical protein